MKNEKLFPEVTLKYLTHLSKNNNREWFEKNRDRFSTEFLEPAMDFVVQLGQKLSKSNPDLQFIPKTDKSIFRLHRDVRFSKNKSPYKTNLGILLWEGSGKKMECSGYYVHLEPGKIFLGTGMYEFTKDQLKYYRELVAEPSKGRELNNLINKLLKNNDFKPGGKTYKRVPKGYDENYKYADLLKYSGLYLYYENDNTSDLSNKSFVNFCFNTFKQLRPLHNWLVKNIA